MLRLFAILNARYAQQRARTMLSVVGIALGVALGYGVHLVNSAAVGEIEAAERASSGTADLVVRGARAGFPEALYVRIARLPGIALASPALELQVGVAGTRRTIHVLGIDPFRAAPMHPAVFAADPKRFTAIVEPDQVIVSDAAARTLGLARGGRLRLVAGEHTVELNVADVVGEPALRGLSALTDIATAQWRLGRLGNLNRINLRLAPGADRAATMAKIAALLPAGVHVAPAEAAELSSATPSRAYRVNLNVLALVALFTGGFLVFSAQALEVMRRRREHALLRVLGLERGGVARLVLAEAAAIGLLGSVAGLALGYLLAAAALRISGADLGAGLFRGLAPSVEFAPLAAAVFLVAGTAIAVVGAVLPALEAARRAPARALRPGDEQSFYAGAATPWAGVALVAGGAALARLGPVEGIPVFGYASIALLLVGGIAVVPWVAARLLARSAFGGARSSRGWRVPWTLARAQLRGSPGQTMLSLASIVASFALMVAMGIMVSSFRGSVAQWLDAVLSADLYLRTPPASDTAYLEPGFEDAVRALPGVAEARFLRSGRIVLAPGRPPVTLLARDLPAGGEPRVYPPVGARYEPRPGDPRLVWVSEAMVDLYGCRPGTRLVLPLAGTNREVVVGGVWRDYARQNGAILMRRADYIGLTGDRRVNEAALRLAPSAVASEVAAEVRRLPGAGNLEISLPGQIRAASLALFDRSFAVTYAMEAVAVLVGLFGLSSSLGSIVIARRAEFGVLRHLGMTRAQIAAMLAAEGGLLAALGTAAGLALGAAISLVLVEVVNRQSFHWSMDLHPPYLLLALLGAALLVLASVTAFVSGREATGMGPVRAVREDW